MIFGSSASFTRNTPTGVGKTSQPTGTATSSWKHPHGRGEDPCSIPDARLAPETPPRAWGRQNQSFSFFPLPGNTPTGVGKTFQCFHRATPPEKHPHGRGEDRCRMLVCPGKSETPPRAWGRQSQVDDVDGVDRNTPTGVGKTARYCSWIHPTQKHPHGRGEDESNAVLRVKGRETPPRAWGRQIISPVPE